MTLDRQANRGLAEQIVGAKSGAGEMKDVTRLVRTLLAGMNRRVTYEVERATRHERTETATFDYTAPSRLKPDEALRIRDALLMAKLGVRNAAYGLLSQKKEHDLLHVGERSMLDSRGHRRADVATNPDVDQQALREIARIRLFKGIVHVAPSMSMLLEECTFEPTGPYGVKIVPPQTYSLATLRAARNQSFTPIKMDGPSALSMIQSEDIQGIAELFRQQNFVQSEAWMKLSSEAARTTESIERDAWMREMEGASSNMVSLLAALAEHEAPTVRGREERTNARASALDWFASLAHPLRAAMHALAERDGSTKKLLNALPRAMEAHLGRRGLVAMLEIEWNRAGLPLSVTKALGILSTEWTPRHAKRSTIWEIPDTYSDAVLSSSMQSLEESGEDAESIADYVTKVELRETSKALYQLEHLLRDPTALSTRQTNAPVLSTTIPTQGNVTGKDGGNVAFEPSRLNAIERDTAMESAKLIGVRAATAEKSIEQWSPAEWTDRMRLTRGDMSAAALRVESMKGLEQDHGRILVLADRFADYSRSIAKAVKPDGMAAMKRGNHLITTEELAHLLTFAHHVAFDLASLSERTMEGDGNDQLLTRLDGAAFRAAGGFLMREHVEEHFGKRLGRHGVLKESMNKEFDLLAARISELRSKTENERVRRILSLLESALSSTFPLPTGDETSLNERIPMDSLAGTLADEGVDLAASMAWFNDRSEEAKPTETAQPLKNPMRVSIAKYLRHLFPSKGKVIPFERAREFLAPAGITAEANMTEHPWYWTCALPGKSGRHAITWDRHDNGFFHTEILAVLFGHNESRGIGDVDALYRSIPDEWKKDRQSTDQPPRA